MKCLLHLFFFLIILGLLQTGCDRIPEEGTIVYDVDYPRADEVDTGGGGGSGGGGSGSGGGSGGGPTTVTNPNGSGAGYTVSKTIANVYEDGSVSDNFTIVLTAAPSANVVMGLANPDTTEVSLSPSSLTFSTVNWSTAQTILLTGVEDGIADGNQATNLTVYVNSSTDGNYSSGVDNSSVTVNSADSSSVAAITITTTGGNNSVTESSGNTDNFTIALATRPAQNVTVSLTSADTGEVTVSPSSVVFTSINYSSARTIVLTPVEDGTADGNQNVNISANATSSDISYNGLSQTTPVTVVDSGISAGITITTTGGNSVTESSGTTDTFTVQLNSAPTSNVTLTLTSADTGEVTVAPSSVVFASGNFSSAQTITLTPIEDYAADGNQNVNISANATSTDILYNGLGQTTSVSVIDSGTALSTPSNLTATAVYSDRINVLWDRVAEADNYTIEFGTSSGSYSGSTTVTSSSTRPPFYHTSLTISTPYYYRVRSNNAGGSSAWSSEVSATTLAPGFTLSRTTATVTESGASGNDIWTRMLTGPFWHGAGRTYTASDSQGNAYIAGTTSSAIGSSLPDNKSTVANYTKAQDFVIAKYNSGGERLWVQQVGSTSNDDVYGIEVDSEDNIIVVGTTGDADFAGTSACSDASYNLAIVKLNSSGVQQWSTTTCTTFTTLPYGMTVDSNNNIYIVGKTYYDVGPNSVRLNSMEMPNTLTTDAFLAKYNSSGVIQKTAIIASTKGTGVGGDYGASEEAQAVAVDNLGNIYVSGETAMKAGREIITPVSSGSVAPQNRKFAFLVRYDSNFSNAWIRTFVSTTDGGTAASDLKIKSNGNVVIFGDTSGSLPGFTDIDGTKDDYWFAEYDSNGNQQWLHQEVLAGYSGGQSYSGRWHDVLAIDQSDNLYVLGNTDIYLTPAFDQGLGTIIKFNSNATSRINTVELPYGYELQKLHIVSDTVAYVSGYNMGFPEIMDIAGQVNGYGTKGNLISQINPSASPATSNLGRDSITLTMQRRPTSYVRVCPSHSSPDELLVGPNGANYGVADAMKLHTIWPLTYNDEVAACLHFWPNYNTTEPLVAIDFQFYSIQDNVTDGNQVVPVSFTVESDDSDYHNMTIPNVNVTVVDAALAVPKAPLQLTATASGTDITLNWAKPITALGEGITNYTLQWNNDNGSSWTNITGITGTTHSHTGLSGNTNYYYKVFANNAAGAGPTSNVDNATTGAANGVTITHSGGSTTVNEAGYGEGVYDWSDLIGNSGDDRAYAVTRDAIGNVYVGVQTTSSLQGSNAGSHDAALVKYNSVGIKQWTRQTGSSAADYVKAVATDSEGNAYIIGDVSNASYDGQSASGDRDVFITKYSSNGTKQWSKQFGTAQNDQVADAVIDNNTLYIIGSTKGTMSGASKTSASATYQDSFITRLDSSGNILGSDQFGVSGTNNTVASDMAFDDSGNYYVAGSSTGALDSESHSGNSKTDMFIRKYNSSNVRQWTKLIGNSTHDQGNGVHLGLSSSGATIYLQDQTGGTINSVSAPTSASDHLVIHAIRASDRAFEWTKFTSHRANTVRGIGADSSGYIYTLHDSSISPAGYDDDLDGNYQITKFNSSGTEQWARLTGSGDSGFDFPLGMYVTKGGQLYVAGTTQAGVLNSSSTWDYKFHGETSSGSFDAVIFKANGANDYVGRDNITVVLSAAPSATVTANIAGFSTEFTVEPTQLTFTTGNWNTPQTVYIHGIQDNTTDGNQTENLTITTSSSDSNYNGLTVNTPVTIAEQAPIAPSVGVGFDNATVTEGNSGTQTRTLTAYLDQLHSSNVTVNLAYGSGSSCTATSGSSNDFAHSSSTMTISAGQSQATQNVNIYGDTTVEDNETACIDISSVTNGVEEGTQRATLTIINDDTASSPAFRYSATSGSTSVSETGTTDNLNLYLASAPNGNVVVDVTVSDSTEISVSPTQLTFTNANYTNTQNITVTGVDDALDDNDTVSQVTIAINGSTTDTTGYASLSSSSRNVTTTDDEVPPSGTPSLTNAVAATQQVTLSWSTLSGATYYKFYYKQDSTVNYSINVANSSTYDGTFTVNDGSATSYVHAGLSAGRYHYTMVAGNVAGESAQSNMRDAGVVSNFSTTSCNADNDTDLLVHYDFDSTANDKARKYGDGRYDLSVANGGSITYANSRCTGGKAAYFNAGNQYGYNTSLNDDNESNLFNSGNFTVSLWFYADPDMPDYSSMMSSKIFLGSGGDGGNHSWQLDSRDRKLRWRSQQGVNSSTKVHTLADTRYPTNSWGHGAFVKHDNGTAQIYMNSTLVATRLNNQPTPMDMLKIGTNRQNQLSWKGYIDEFKIYSRALTAGEVNNLYDNDTPSSTGTAWSKGLDFSGSSGYARFATNGSSENPLHRVISSISPSSTVSSGNTASSGQPWAVASVFKTTNLSTDRTLWSQADHSSCCSNHWDQITLKVTTSGEFLFKYGDGSNALQWRSASGLATTGNWYGVYADYNGGSIRGGSGDLNKFYGRFRFRLVNLSTGAVSNINGSNSNWSNTNHGNPSDVTGYFYVGSYLTESSNRFQGQIASTVVTTLNTNTSLPNDTEISMMVRDPMGWLSNYKVGNSWRKPNETAATSNFALGSNTGEQGTKIWLMGDGTNDSSSNIANQVNNSDSNQYLQLNSTSPTAVSIPGL